MSILIWRLLVSLFVPLTLMACGQPPQVGALPSSEQPLSPTVQATQPPPTLVSPAIQVTVRPSPTVLLSSPEATAIRKAYEEPTIDFVSLVDYLRRSGLTVKLGGFVSQNFLQATGRTLEITGGNIKQPSLVQVYVYDDADFGGNGLLAAESDAKRIKPDGSIEWVEPDGMGRAMSIMWAAAPHFYRKGRTLVIYLGSDQRVLDLLTALLGPQFGGQ